MTYHPLGGMASMPREVDLLRLWQDLNAEGKAKVLAYIDDLISSSSYRKKHSQF